MGKLARRVPDPVPALMPVLPTAAIRRLPCADARWMAAAGMMTEACGVDDGVANRNVSPTLQRGTPLRRHAPA